MTIRNLLIPNSLWIWTSIFLFGCLISHCFRTASRARAYKGLLASLRALGGRCATLAATALDRWLRRRVGYAPLMIEM